MLYAFGAAFFALVGALAVGWWGTILGLLLFGIFLAMPYYRDWQ